MNPLQLNEKFVGIPKDIDFAYCPDMILTKKYLVWIWEKIQISKLI